MALLSAAASTATSATGAPLGAPAFVFPLNQLDASRAALVPVGSGVYVHATRSDEAAANSAAVALTGN